jgi:hypothetical protein
MKLYDVVPGKFAAAVAHLRHASIRFICPSNDRA